MAGALIGLIGYGTVGGSGSPSAIAWGPIYGTDTAASNTQAFSGFTGSISVSGALSGGGTLTYILNGVYVAYSGTFSVNTGDTLSWVITVGHVAKSGNLTVTNVTASTTIATVAYSVDTSWNGSGYR